LAWSSGVEVDWFNTILHNRSIKAEIHKSMKKSLIIAAFCCLTGPLLVPGADAPKSRPALPPPQRVVIPKLHGKLTLDGALNESVWAKAALLTPFALNDDSRPEREKTAVRLWYDTQALHLGWTCTDADIQATFTARDSKFWEEEVVEFFVTPGPLDRYFELQWNPLGGVFDAIIRNQMDAHGVSTNFTGDWSFTARGMTNAVKVKGTVSNSRDKDEMWQVEVSLPFADLGESTPKPGAVWRANFYRYNRTQGQPPELLSWSPTHLPGFHQPARFGYLEFGK
jgi:hypothetical protein